MRMLICGALAAPLLFAGLAAQAQGYPVAGPPPPPYADPAVAPKGGTYPLGYDTGGDQDKRPELAPYQQGGGQQTGGPARNAIPSDIYHFEPR